MKDLLLLFLVLASTFISAYADVSNCFYGITQDGDVDPEDDWKSKRCMTDEDEQCLGAYCLGPSAACFKARYEGDDEFLSVYGCVADVFYPEEHGPEDNRIPAGLDFTDLGLESLPTIKDSCLNDGDEDTEEWSGNPEFNDQVTPLGGSDVGARWCICVENGCNGAENVKRSAALVLAAVGVIVTVMGA